MAYRIVLKDKDGCEVSSAFEESTLKAAKIRAKYLLSNEYAIASESTHDQTEKAEILNDAGECIWDEFMEFTILKDGRYWKTLQYRDFVEEALARDRRTDPHSAFTVVPGNGDKHRKAVSG